MSDCASDIVEIYFKRGELSAGKDETCWVNVAGVSSLKNDPKSPKCILVSAMNSALQSAGALNLEESGRTLSISKKTAAVDSQNLQMQYEISLSSSLPNGSCVASLPNYQPQKYGRGEATYSLKPKGDLDLFLPINSIESAVHLVVKEGAYCRYTSQSTTVHATGVKTTYSVVPTGQFEMQSRFATPTINVAGVAASSAGLGTGPGGPTSSSPSGHKRYLQFKAPLSAAMSISKSISAGPMSTDIQTSASLSGTLNALFLLEMSCSRTNGISLTPVQGTVTDIVGTVSENLAGTTSDCSDSSCSYYSQIQTNLNATWNAALLAMPTINLPSLTAYKDAGLFLSIDTQHTGILEGKALRIPFEVSDTNPCSEDDSGGSGGGGGGYIPPTGPGGNLPGIDINPWDNNPGPDEGRDPGAAEAIGP